MNIAQIDYNDGIPYGNEFVDLSKIKSAVITSNFHPNKNKGEHWVPKLVRCCKTHKVYKTIYRNDLYPGYYDIEEITDKK